MDPYDSVEGLNNSYKIKGDVSITETLLDFDRLRISALTKAAIMSPFVKEVTIGPKSPKKKDISKTKSPEKEIEPAENLYRDLHSDDLRYIKLMNEQESKLQKTSSELFDELVGNIIFNHADMMNKYIQQSEHKVAELKMRELLSQFQDNDNLQLLEQARLEEKHSKMINMETIENMNRILEEQNKATARFASVTDSHTKICVCFNEIAVILQTEIQAKEVGEKYVTPVSTIMANIGTIIESCKTGVLVDKDVKQAEDLSREISDIRSNLKKDIHDFKEREMLKKQEEEAKLKYAEQIAEQEKIAKEQTEQAVAETSPSIRSRPQFYSDTNYSYYKELNNFVNDYEKKYTNLLGDVNVKKFRFDCQKAVNTPVNALSSVSGSQMKDKYDKLSKLLRGERVQVFDSYVTASAHPEGIFYCTALLAKKIVRQGDLLVSSKPEAAFPLAAITVALWTQFPDFGKLLEGYFNRFCPYLVPMFLPQKEGQTDKEYYLSRGYTYNDEGVVEKQDKFLKRMSGLFRLKCAIWITNTPRFITTPNPMGLRYAWQWLASFLNLKPEADISATLIYDFFTVCGSAFRKNYGKQFDKIIRLISTEYLVILENIDEGGPKTRLEVLLQNIIKSGHISPPNGLLPPNIW